MLCTASIRHIKDYLCLKLNINVKKKPDHSLTIEKITSQMKQGLVINDPIKEIATFLQEKLVEEKLTKVASGDVRQRYLLWYKGRFGNDVGSIITETRWGLRLSELGIKRKPAWVNGKTVSAIVGYKLM